MEQENLQKTNETKPESSTEERASFASIAKQKEANKTHRDELRKVKSQLNNDRVFLILGAACVLISFVFLQLSFSKAEYSVNRLSLSYITFFVLVGGGAFLLIFGFVRFLLHKKKVKEYEKE